MTESESQHPELIAVVCNKAMDEMHNPYVIGYRDELSGSVTGRKSATMASRRSSAP